MALSSLVWGLGIVALGVLAYCAVCVVLLLFADIPNDPPYSYLSDVMVIVTLPFVLGFSVLVGYARS